MHFQVHYAVHLETNVSADPPPPFTRAVQRSPGGAWLFPLAGAAEKEEIEIDKGKDGGASAAGTAGGGGGAAETDAEVDGGWLVIRPKTV